jgi:hypothetical protein
MKKKPSVVPAQSLPSSPPATSPAPNGLSAQGATVSAAGAFEASPIAIERNACIAAHERATTAQASAIVAALLGGAK